MSTTIPGNISQPTIPPEPLGGRVLIVDDELSTRAYLKKILATRGCEVLEAADGALALQLARAHKPDLMLLDVMMPGTGGYEVCQTMKSDPVLREIPIIMVTVRSDIADVEHAFQLGAFDYVRKPFNPRELIARVRNALLLKRSTEEVCAWKQKMSRELELAGSLQRKLFSAQPLLTEHFAVHSVFQPSMNIGGDFFDVLPLKDGGLAVGGRFRGLCHSLPRAVRPRPSAVALPELRTSCAVVLRAPGHRPSTAQCTGRSAYRFYR
ncbi:MAG: response regulator [Kiritimatiellaeota bacterium]|nr:response regulator [Kiritimatiellota bacterium]